MATKKTEDIKANGDRIVRSSCRGCHGVCQVLVQMEGDRITRISGDPDSPTSRGFICPKGAASAEMLYHPDRIQYPPSAKPRLAS